MYNASQRYRFTISDPDDVVADLLSAFKHQFCRTFTCQARANRANKLYIKGHFTLDKPYRMLAIRKQLPILRMFIERESNQPKQKGSQPEDPPATTLMATTPAAATVSNASPLLSWFRSRPSITAVLAHGIKSILNHP